MRFFQGLLWFSQNVSLYMYIGISLPGPIVDSVKQIHHRWSTKGPLEERQAGNQTGKYFTQKNFQSWNNSDMTFPPAPSLKRVSSRFTIHRKKCSWDLGIRVEWVWSFEKWKRRSQKICVSFQGCWSGLDPDRIRIHLSCWIRIRPDPYLFVKIALSLI